MIGISVLWDERADNMLRMDISGTWLWPDIYDAHRQAWEMVEQTGRPATLVYNLDLFAWHQYPIHSVVVPMQNVYKMHHPNVIQVIAITGTQSVFVRSMVQMLLRQLPQLHTLSLARDLNEARQITAQVTGIPTKPGTGTLHPPSIAFT
ncbi:MAG: hypothetical protein KJ065_18385 [Anaerolineae bacterium]|nr:hypothetical protein [Anaerolineae bacterium]